MSLTTMLIKPIFGLEAYTGPRKMRELKQRAKWHQTILAADQTGYHNLMQLVGRYGSRVFPGSARQAALTIAVDEAYHALVAREFRLAAEPQLT